MTLLQHLQARHLDTRLHTVWLDEQAGLAAFPLWNLSGKLLGYQQYRPSGSKSVNNDPREGKYFTRKLNNAEPTYWGIESWYLSNTLFLVEGLFDAARITALGYSALAVFTNNPGANFSGFIKLVQKMRPVVAVCDNDVAGRKLAKYGHTSHVMEDGKDMGEASDEYVSAFLKQYS